MTIATTTTRTLGAASVAALAIALGVGLAGCQPEPDKPVPSRPSPTSGPHPGHAEAVEAAYEQYWTYLHELDKKPVGTWRDQLARVAADPQLSATLSAMRYQRDIGESAYGHVTARIEMVEISGRKARVSDCQDASRSGLQDTKSGRKKNRGIARNPVRADLRQSASDGRWRVVKISYPGGEC